MSSSTDLDTTQIVLIIGALAVVYAGSTGVVFKAFRRRSWGWIIGGLIGGMILLATCALGATCIGFVIYRVNHSTGSGANSFPKSYISHVMQGWKMAYSIVLPEGWTPGWADPDFDMTAEHDGLHIGIVAGQSVGSTEEIERMAYSKIRDVTSESHAGDAAPVQIDGRTWQQFDARYRMTGSSPQQYRQFYVYSGPEGMFQVVGWRSGDFLMRDAATVRGIAASFRFPPGPSPPLPAAMTIQGKDNLYRLTVPAGWSVKRFSYVYDFLATRPPVSVGVILINGQASKSEELVRTDQNDLRQGSDGVQFSETSMVRIDGRDWLYYTAKGQLKKGTVFQQECYTYVGPEGTYRLVGWMTKGWREADESAMRETIMSFHFRGQP